VLLDYWNCGVVPVKSVTSSSVAVHRKDRREPRLDEARIQPPGPGERAYNRQKLFDFMFHSKPRLSDSSIARAEARIVSLVGAGRLAIFCVQLPTSSQGYNSFGPTEWTEPRRDRRSQHQDLDDSKFLARTVHRDEVPAPASNRPVGVADRFSCP